MSTCKIYKNAGVISDKIRTQQVRRLNLKTPEERIEYQKDLPFYIMCDGEIHIRVRCEDADTVLGSCPVVSGIELKEKIEKETEGEFKTFENFKGHDDIVGAVKGFEKGLHQTLILTGLEGRGKSHLGRALQIRFIEHGKTAEFVTAVELSRAFNEAQPYHDDIDTRYRSQKKLNRLKEAGLLVIDDLGDERETKTDFFREQFKEMLDRISGKLFITTNLKIYSNDKYKNFSDDQKRNTLNYKYDRRVISRILETAVIIQLKGRDMRMVK